MTTQTAQHWRLRGARYSLTGSECASCSQLHFPPRDLCGSCGSAEMTPYTFSGNGTVYSFTIVYHPPAGYEFASPYALAIIELEEGPLVTAQLTDVDLDTVEIGQPVEMVTRKLKEEGEQGMIVYGYKFRPRHL